MKAREVQKKLRSLGDRTIAEHSQRFFKTGPGEYGEGDQFLGIRVPVLRKEAKGFQGMALEEGQRLLTSPYHEERLFALLLLVVKFARGNDETKTAIYNLYLKNTPTINNWDLVDSSASQIVGAYLEDKNKAPLYRLAKAPNLWERRIAIIATLHFIKKNQFAEALALSAILKEDKEDLIHKAVGWMLREIGKRDGAVERVFLKKHYSEMPRTMLRYAIERFPEKERQKYLQGKA